MAYIIKRHGRRYGSKSFTNYEEARSYVRKTLRKDKSLKSSKGVVTDDGWLYHNNPSITSYGFKIESRAVA